MISYFRGIERKRHFRAAPRFRAALREIGRGDIAIDGGANVGDYTLAMAATGAQVFAFEPNPDALAVLKKRTADRPNVIVLDKALGAVAGVQKLYLHKRSSEDPLRFSTGSSLLRFKRNVDPERSVEVEVVDFLTFVRSLGGKVSLVKMDIEGAEVEILERLLDAGQPPMRIERMFVEMHDPKAPELSARSDAIRAAIALRGIDWIDLRWQ